jgi:hypothetical protein
MSLLVIANAIALFWMLGAIHLFIYNLFAAFLERAIMVDYGFSLSYGKLLLANIMSVFIGSYIIPYATMGSIGLPSLLDTFALSIENFWQISYRILVAFSVTVFVEYPFFLWALKEKEKKTTLFVPFLKSNLITTAVTLIFMYIPLGIAL